jgi:predicted nucleic acid-binding protein
MRVEELAGEQVRPPRTLRQALASRRSREEPIFLVTKYVIGPDVAIHLAHGEAMIPGEHQVLAPTLLRSQMLSLLYQSVHRGEMDRRDAERRLNYVRGLRIRLLGDRVLQNVAWKVADQLGWPDTFDAEYIALTQLQADAFITLDRQLAHAVQHLVTVAPIEALSGSNKST